MAMYRWMIALCVCCAALPCSAQGQSYPRWFLYQGEIASYRIGVGYVQPALHPDSASMYAFRLGCTEYAMHRRLSIAGGEIFWSTEGGTAWMGSDITVRYDTSIADRVQSEFRVLDTYHDAKKTITLAGDASVTIDDALKAVVPVGSIRMPDWVETLPSDARMRYAVGAAQEYYYETSSWELAERIARLTLARQIGTKVSARQTLDEIEGQDLRHDEFAADLHDIRVIARWRDVQKKIFYVLIAMPQ
jgi:hypothetical protein